jgi:tRNA/tmRNA/rRNA uracil-C5-methylase (TrmA/RlmC/RlmD family)
VTARQPSRGAGIEPAGLVGERFEVEVGAVAHGGHCVARVPDGRVVFVRHSLPGELVRIEVTEEHSGYLRADAVQVLRPAPGRVTPPCPYAGTCGGCDFQHVDPDVQRELKAAVVREQLTRLARLSPDELAALDIRVAALPGGALGWRTRVRYAVDATGRAGLLAHRSHQVVGIDRCRIAHPAIQAQPVTDRPWPDDDQVETVAGADGVVTVSGDRSGLVAGAAQVTERALGRTWRLPVQAFWQVHPAAAETFAATVLELLDPRPGEHAWDLYGGAGLFAAALAGRVGPTGSVTLVEADRTALAGAQASLADLPWVQAVPVTVERFRPAGPPVLVVLDPPRSGAGTRVARMIADSGARAVAYVACDPAAFARDVAAFRERGWRLAQLRAFDAFPMTHHVECVGLLRPPP